ncbi:MAG: hypothetical protein HY270_17545 [Deltaproteobacteria bacterium]|nr:hypothetical protein [Deltaproteobacteria bacterium]
MYYVPRQWVRIMLVPAAAVAAFLWASAPLQAIDCLIFLPAFQQGVSDVDIARSAGLPVGIVSSCRAELSRPIHLDPAGPPPSGAVGPPPFGAAGRPPLGAAGPPPSGAAGPPPIGRDVRRLP